MADRRFLTGESLIAVCRIARHREADRSLPCACSDSACRSVCSQTGTHHAQQARSPSRSNPAQQRERLPVVTRLCGVFCGSDSLGGLLAAQIPE